MKKQVYIDTSRIHNDKNAIIIETNSDRSDGKTTDIMRHAYDDFKKDGRARVISRRYVGEVTKLTAAAMLTALHKVRPNIEDLHFDGTAEKDGIHFYAGKQKFADFIPLSRAGKVKGAFNIATHKDLYLDEYCPLDLKFLPNEVLSIMELHKTIDRRSQTSKIYVYSNKLSAYTPLHAMFQIVPTQGLHRYKNGRYIVLQIHNKGNAALEQKSAFGELINGTPLSGYYLDGGEAITHENLICAKHTRAAMPLVISHAGKYYKLYETGDGRTVIDYCPAPQDEPVYTVTANAGRQGGIYIAFVPTIQKVLKTLYCTCSMLCASEQIFLELRDLWKLLK